MRYLTPLIVGLLVACTPPVQTREDLEHEQSLIDISDLYQAGHEQIRSYLATRPELGRMMDSSLVRIPMITLLVEYEDGEQERIQQSGVFVADGRYILTAGHGFYLDDGRLIDLKAHTMSGHELTLNIIDLRYNKQPGSGEDWAILQPVVHALTGGIQLDNSTFPDKEAVILGFPGGMALNDSDRVVHALENERGAVYPLAVICYRLVTRPNILKPRVGAIPIRGMSGAPVLNFQGRLIGLFSSVSRTRTVNGWQYIFYLSNLPGRQLDSLAVN